MTVATQTRQLFQSATGSPLGRVVLAGTLHKSRGVPTRQMRILGSYAVVYLLDGGGWYQDARGCQKEVRAGDLLVLFPDLGHLYGPPPDGHWDEIYIMFDGPVFDLWQERQILSPAMPVYHLEPIKYWFGRFADVAAPNLPALERVCRLQAALAEALIHYQRDPAAARDEEWLAKARTLLDADVEKELYVEDVARQLGISLETFRKKFARLAGTPPWHYRMARVIDHACELVHERRLTGKEIAERLGFSDEFHFSRRFKQITGHSPTEFRALVAGGVHERPPDSGKAGAPAA